MAFTYCPLVTTYPPPADLSALDGAGNRLEVERAGETESYTLGAPPGPADADVNQYTQTPQDVGPRQYDENGNILHTGAALPTRYRHDYLDRITQAIGMPDIGGGSVPAGSEFSDDFTGGMDGTWELDPAFTAGLPTTQWVYDSGAVTHAGGSNIASSANPRENPDGDSWWVYTRPSGASGTNVMTAYLRTLGSEDDIITPPSTLQALYLDIDTTGIILAQWQGGTVASSSAITTDDDTPYLIHAHVVGSTVIVRRGELGGPMATILETHEAPLQNTDRFILESASACIVDDVNIGHSQVEYSLVDQGSCLRLWLDATCVAVSATWSPGLAGLSTTAHGSNKDGASCAPRRSALFIRCGLSDT